MPCDYDYVDVSTGRMPAIENDLLRNLVKGSRALTRDRLIARPVIYTGQQAMRPWRQHIAFAYAGRCLEKRRPVRLCDFHRDYSSADLLAVLLIGGRLAAWDLLCHGAGELKFLAGQMAPASVSGDWRPKDYRPGRLLEMWLTAWAATHPGIDRIDLGQGFTESLLPIAGVRA